MKRIYCSESYIDTHKVKQIMARERDSKSVFCRKVGIKRSDLNYYMLSKRLVLPDSVIKKIVMAYPHYEEWLLYDTNAKEGQEIPFLEDGGESIDMLCTNHAGRRSKRLPKALLKIVSSEERAVNLLEKGEIYCNKIGYFLGEDSSTGRGDKYEAVQEIVYDEESQEEIVLYDNAMLDNHIYCMYCITLPDQLVDEEKVNDFAKYHESNIIKNAQSKKLGEWIVVIIDADEFKRRFYLEASKISRKIQDGLVEYREKEMLGKGGVALPQKVMDYAHQSEYRLLVYGALADSPIKFYLGELRDIAFCVHVSKLNIRIGLGDEKPYLKRSEI